MAVAGASASLVDTYLAGLRPCPEDSRDVVEKKRLLLQHLCKVRPGYPRDAGR